MAIALLTALLLSATPASALNVHVFSGKSFGVKGTGVGGAGEVSGPAGVAVNSATHDVYVADPGYHRVDEFQADGTFVRAFGANVGGLGEDVCGGLVVCGPGTSGSSPGELTTPTFVAVDNSSGGGGDVYVGDTDGVVTKFSEDGVLESTWGVGGRLVRPLATGEGNLKAGSSTIEGVVESSGTFAAGEEIEGPGIPAGDRITNAPGGGVLEISEPAEAGGTGVALVVPSRLAGIAVGAAGTLYVMTPGGAAPMFKFEQDGKFIEEFATARETKPLGLAVNPEGDFFKVNSDESVEEGTGTGSDLGAVTAGVSATGVAVDSATGDLYVASSGLVSDYAFNGLGEVITGGGTCRVEPHAGCTSTDTFGSGEAGGGELTGADGIAVDSSTASASSGSVYVADGAADRIVVFAEAVIPDVKVEPPVLTPTSATLEGTVKPDGVPLTAGAEGCRFEYASEAEYASTKTYGHSVPCTPGASEIPSGAGEVTHVSASLSSLPPDAVYHYRLSAADANGTSPTADQQLTTPGPGVPSESVTDVRSTSATFEATIEPHGTATSYYFQYGPTTAYDHDAPLLTEAAPGGEALGSGETPVEVTQHVQDLTAGVLYHYRVMTVSQFNGVLEELPGEDHTLTTQTGGEAGLPDDRTWELVSPPDKHGAELKGTAGVTFVQAAADGDAVVYSATDPTESQPRGHGEGTTQVLSNRASGGWESHDLQNPHTEPVGAENISPYVFFSSDLSLGVLRPEGGFEPTLSSEATEKTPYLFHSSTRTYTPLVIGCTSAGVCPADRNDTTEPFVPFGGEAEGECTDEPGPGLNCPPNPEGANAGLSDIILGPGVVQGVPPLLKGANEDDLYEWSAGKPASEQLQLVSVLPDGDPAVERSTLGAANYLLVSHAVSEDGSRVIWEQFGGPSFMRDMASKETIELPDGFEAANANDTLVFGAGKECEVIESVSLLPDGEHLECEPVDEQGTHKEIEDGTVLATSEDGSIVYFQNGESIYVRHGNGQAKLVASNVGHTGGESGGVHEREPPLHPWRASPNGEWFAFMSDSPLTGYNNRDAVSGARDEEVYLYSAAAERLVCASCDPTGERPHGSTALHLPLADYADIVEAGQSVAATIPGWAPYLLGQAVYDPRVVSNSGRLFFNATDGLVPKDVNGQVDVYELEQPAGAPGGGEAGDNCTTATRTGSDLYVPAAAGCVALISSGESDEESVFEDASESGEDVFFLSASKLSTADLDGSLSMWDAQVCTTSSPCPPAPAAAPVPCTTEPSCKASPTPQPTIYQAPASATFNGPGNVAPEPPAKPATASTPSCSSSAGTPSTKCTKKQNLTKAVATCKRKYPHSKKKRGGCEAAARKKYAAKASARKSARKSSR